jgi:hypothetical protein
MRRETAQVMQQWGVVTADRPFGSTLRYPLGSHSGIIVIRYSDDISILQMIEAVLMQLRGLEPADVHGSVVVLEQGRVRLRSAKRD